MERLFLDLLEDKFVAWRVDRWYWGSKYDPLIKRFTRDVAADWFRASEASGDFMGIRYGRVGQGSEGVEWYFVSHVECDGIGGFARLLRERGVETGTLPETKHPCRGVIAPLWRLWRDGRKGEKCAGRSDWLSRCDEVENSRVAGWHLFTREETQEMVNRCREMRVTVNSFLLKHLDDAIRPEIAKPKARIRWLIPVNLRGDVGYEDDTANHVSCVEVSIAPQDGMDALQSKILKRLKRGEHRANHLLLMLGGLLSHAGKVDFLRKERAKDKGNIGSFSNLGVWNVGSAPSDGWVFCPPVVSGQLLGAGCVTFQGRLGIAIQGYSCAATRVEGWMGRWVDSVRSV